MYKIIKSLRCVKYYDIFGRFYSTNNTIGHLATSVDELTNNQILYTFETLSKNKVKDWNLWDHLCDKVRVNLDNLEVSDLLKVIHSLARVSYKRLPLFYTINRIILRKYRSIDPRNLTQYLIDLNKLDLLNINTFIPLVSTKLSQDISLFSTFDICFILHLCSKLQYRDILTIDIISSKLLQNESIYQEFSSDKALVSMVFRSLSFLQHKNDLYNNLLHHIIPYSIYHFGAQELCNVLLSIIVSNLNEEFDQRLTNILKALLDRISENVSSLVEIEVNQLGISLYFLKYNMKEFPEKYSKLLDSITKLNIKYTPTTSKMQLKLGNLLYEIKLKYKSEFQVGPYKLDYVIPKLNVAIEVNGYTHFFHNSKDLNSLTQLKYKILNNMGWNVVGINYYNWKNRNKQSRLDYLLKKLSPYLDKAE